MKKVSAEEKRQRLLSVFHETQDFFTIKEIEKIGPKKGISSQVVKDVLQQLIDDDLVTTEKVGNRNFYFSFPQTKDNLLKDQLLKLKNENQKLISEIENLTTKIQTEEKNRTVDTTEYFEFKRKEDEMEKKLSVYSNVDPDCYDQKKKDADDLRNNINELTDKLFCMQSYVSQKFGLDKNDFNKSFGIDDDMDYVN
ncbi:Meiotic nuclear division protein 1 like protein [Dictyocoela muelleri]|nr:Meiotic nuclear division protein 1 like protein [Dictyocoela muelleri]